MRLLRQPQYHPMKQHQQVILLVTALAHVMQDIPVQYIDGFRQDLIKHMETNASALCRKIDATGRWTKRIRSQ